MGNDKEGHAGFNHHRFRTGLCVMFGSTLIGSAGALLFLTIHFGIGREFPHYEISCFVAAPVLGLIAEAGILIGRIICAWAAGAGCRKWFVYSLAAEATAFLFGFAGLAVVGSVWQFVMVGLAVLAELVSILLLIHGLNYAARLFDRQKLVQSSRRLFDFVIVSSLFSMMATLVYFWVGQLKNVEPPLLIFTAIVVVVVLVNWLRFICLLENFVRRFPSGDTQPNDLVEIDYTDIENP